MSETNRRSTNRVPLRVGPEHPRPHRPRAPRVRLLYEPRPTTGTSSTCCRSAGSPGTATPRSRTCSSPWRPTSRCVHVRTCARRERGARPRAAAGQRSSSCLSVHACAGSVRVGLRLFCFGRRRRQAYTNYVNSYFSALECLQRVASPPWLPPPPRHCLASAARIHRHTHTRFHPLLTPVAIAHGGSGASLLFG